MAQTSGNSQSEPSAVSSGKNPNGGTQQVADKTESCPVIDSTDPPAQDDEQKKTDLSQEILTENCLSKDKYDASWCQGSFTKSLQRAEALLRTRFNPNLKWLLRQKSDDGNWDYENEDNVVACQNLTSRSSVRLQRLEQNLLALSSQYHMLRDPHSGGQLQSCVGRLSPALDGDFYYHPQVAAFSKHYGQLQQLLEERALLLFFHEYTRRSSVAVSFVAKLGTVLERAQFLLAARGQAVKHCNSTWNLGLKILCQELRLHVSHWNLLYAKARTDAYLHRVLFHRMETLSNVRQSLRTLGFQALLLMERCIHTTLSAVAAAQLDRIPRDALEDLLSSVEQFNHVAEEQKVQHQDTQVVFLLGQTWLSSGWPGKSIMPEPFSVTQLMKILAEHRARVAAEQLHHWAAQQGALLSLTECPNQQWEHFLLPHPQSNVPPSSSSVEQAKAENVPEKIPEEPPNELLHVCWSSDLPFSRFIHQDHECLEILFQALVSSTDLLAPHVLKRPHLDRAVTVGAPGEGCYQTSEGEVRLTNRPRVDHRMHRAVHWKDLSKSVACLELFAKYRSMVWKEFNKTVIKHFYHPPHYSSLGSVNQWNNRMVFLLATWISHACKEENIPAECKKEMIGFCTQILTNAAFLAWDEAMCASLGSSLKDKCLPETENDGSAVRTATMNHILQLFPPLMCVLQHLQQTSDSNSGECDARTFRFRHMGSLSRSVATIQSSTFWIMSKAYQFLASWSLTKFLLVTQGDLKALKAAVESLAQGAEAALTGADHSLITQHAAQLRQGVTELQAFSELVLKIFSMDCKKMSVEIFEQTMPSGRHWRVNCKTELPSSPSEYAASAAQSVIGQVLEGVQPLSDEARIPALTEAMTAFMEAWMEHILKQKIKFSIQGALQLKQDFDLIRDLIRSEEYSLSEDLLQRLLSLRVFHQVDSAIVCLLQQPMAKPYMPSRVWEPFRRCCPNSAQVVDQAAAGSLNNLESMDIQAACHQVVTQAEGSLTPELHSTAPPESYLALAQQEWLDLRIHSGSRWKIPSLQCFTRSES
ncbi:uncharacterized protein ccdc142 [Chanos chanos]|uniref:Uncharacterized protein ccdc142 n=1 Tax=Chanos chanos TaxID=29144 RepID=A0A6J2UPM1_CHACN|nr:coiled-coil domain-containing protein 142 [Chanos chanos]